MLPKLIKRISSTFYVTYSIWYSGSSQRNLIFRLSDDAKKIETELGLKKHRMVLRRLRGKSLNGLTYPSKSTSFIDPRRHSYDEILYTILHEALHLKQVQDGDLRWDPKRTALVWKGECFAQADVNEISLARYIMLPWEMDVAARQNIMWYKIFDKPIPYILAKKV